MRLYLVGLCDTQVQVHMSSRGITKLVPFLCSRVPIHAYLSILHLPSQVCLPGGDICCASFECIIG